MCSILCFRAVRSVLHAHAPAPSGWQAAVVWSPCEHKAAALLISKDANSGTYVQTSWHSIGCNDDDLPYSDWTPGHV